MAWHYSMLSLKQAFIVNDNCGIIWIGVIIMEDKFDLERFVKEQEHSFDIAYKEVSNGMKRSHWMWYIFPQIIGLGMTYISQKFSIKSIDEARAYYEHPYLGKNLKDISNVLLTLDTDDAERVFGYPDCLKLRSCMTLFAEAVPDDDVFQKVLDKFYDGEKDNRTVEILRKI